MLRRFARRHKGAFAAGSAVAAALVFGLATATWQFVLKNRAYHVATLARAAEVELRERAQVEELSARRKAYAADMNLVEQALAANNLGRAGSLLDAQRPGSGRPDLRGWEWRYLWQRCQSDALYTFCQLDSSVFSLAPSADGRLVAFGESEGGLSVWNVEKRREIVRFPAADGGMLAAFSPAAPLLAYAAMEIPVSDGDRQIATRRAHQVRFWSAAGEAPGEVPLTDWCRGLAFSKDGQTLLAATSGELLLWDIAAGRKLARFGVKDMAKSRAVVRASRDLTSAAYAMTGGKLRVVDLANGRERWTARAAEENVMALAFSADGKTLASGAGYVESVIRLWDVATGAKLGRLDGHRTWISALVFWAKDSLLASASGDQTIRLWDTDDLPRDAKPDASAGETTDLRA